MYKILDKKGILLDICSNIQENDYTEQAYLIKGKFLEENQTIVLKEVQDLNHYIIMSNEERIQIDKRFLFASLKSFTKNQLVYTLVHTHPRRIDGGHVQFSPMDKVFEESLCKIAARVSYTLPLVFIVVDSKTYNVKLYHGNEPYENINVDTGCKGITCNSFDLRIYHGDNFGVLYHAPTNSLVETSSKVAQKLKELQNRYEDDNLAIMEKMAFELLIGKSFGKNKLARMETNKRFDEKRSIEKLEVMIQAGCNLNCKYCYADGGTYGYEQMHITPEKGREYIESIVKNNVERIDVITFFGGEPAMYPHTIRSICDTCNDLVNSGHLVKLPFFNMVTNGTIYSDLLVETIIKYNINVTISLDGPKYINDKLRVFKNGDGSFDIIKRNIQRFNQHGIQTAMIESTYTKIHEQLNFTREKLKKYINEEFGIETVYIADCSDEVYSPNIKNPIEERKRNIKDFFGNIDEIQDIDVCYYCLRSIKILNDNKPISSFHCSVGSDVIALMCDGKLFPCHRFVSDDNYLLGKIENHTLDLSVYQNTFDKLINIDKSNLEDCKSCWARLFCNRCTWDIITWQKDAESDIRLSYSCNYTKKLLDEFLLAFGKMMVNKESLNDLRKNIRI